MIEIKNQKMLEDYYNKESDKYILPESTLITCDINLGGSTLCGTDITAKNIDYGNIIAKNLTAESLCLKNISVSTLTANNIIADNISAKHVPGKEFISIEWSAATKEQLEGTEPWGGHDGYFEELDTSNGDDFTDINETLDCFFEILEHEFRVEPFAYGFEYDEYGRQKEIFPDDIKLDYNNYEVTYYSNGEPVLKYYDFHLQGKDDENETIYIYPKNDDEKKENN